MMNTLYSSILILFAAVGMMGCTVYRGVTNGAPKITSYKIFENDTIKRGNESWHFEKGHSEKLEKTIWTR